jgi:hypothetical protein
MDGPLADHSWRSLERLCRRQASLAATPEARIELECMALEYKQLADAQDRQRADPEQPPAQGSPGEQQRFRK